MLSPLTPLILHFEPVSRSVASPRSTEDLHWLLNALRTLGSAVTLTVLACEGHEPQELREADWLEDMQGVHVLRYGAATLVGALMEAVEAFGSTGTTYAYVTLATALMPRGSLDSLLVHHRGSQSWCTTASGLPIGVAPVIFERGLLDVAGSVQNLAPQRDIGLQLGDLFRQCVKVLRQAGTTTASFAELDAKSVLKLDPNRLPRSVELDSPAALTRLRQLAKDRPEADSGDNAPLLHRWRDALATEQAGQFVQPVVRPRRHSQRPRILFASYASAYTGAAESLCKMISALPSRL